MKKKLLSLVSIFLVLAMLLACAVGCNEDPPPVPDDGDTPSPSAPAPDPYTHAENYFKAEQFNTIKAALESRDSAFASLDASMVPAISLNVAVLSDCSITSISIPVQKTLEADALGEFTFTISIVGTALDGMRATPTGGRTLKISGAEHELAENSYVYRYVTVDLSDDPILLEKNETIALGAAEDTLIAAYVKTEKSDTASYLKMQCKETGMFTQGASENIAYDRDLLCFDFVLKKTYESETAYNAFVADQKAAEDAFSAKVQALKDAGYKGKKISIVGDSISTFSGVSNDSNINSTIGANYVHNTANTNVCDWTMTYWGRLITELEMELCVPNCYSGARSYGTESKQNGNDSMVYRADQLHRDNRTPNDPTDDIAPDIILVYMGINDMLTSPKVNFLSGVNDVAATTKTWMETVVQPKYDAYDPSQSAKINWADSNDPTSTYASWQEAYAMGLMLMQETYPDAEIWIMTLVDSHAHNSGKNGRIDYGNLYIRAIANYFGLKMIDQQKNGYITKQNAYLYGQDEGTGIYALHPNIMGMELTMRLIVEEIYKYLPK